MRIVRSARFGAPVGEVFAFVADFRTLKEYNPSILSVRPLTEGPPRRGARFELTLSLFGLKLRPVLTITDFTENERIETSLDAFLPAVENRTFQADGNETLFAFTIEFRSGWPLIGTFVDRLLAGRFAEVQADTEIRLLERRFQSGTQSRP